MALRKLKHADYTVGWICALPCETTVAKAMFDEEHDSLDQFSGDKNAYNFGSIAGHNVVVANLPMGEWDQVDHHNCGGVPTQDIRLGDVVVGVPQAGNPAILQYDYGKMLADGKIKQTGHLNNPDGQLLAAAASLRARHDLSASSVSVNVGKALTKGLLSTNGYAHPGSQEDILCVQDCEHGTETVDCTECEPKTVVRKPRKNTNPVIAGMKKCKNRLTTCSFAPH